MTKPIEIYVDADACPVKEEVYRVAERHGLKVFVVSNSPIAVPREPWIERVVVGAGMDAADDWIAERAGAGDIVITADVPLASRGVKAGAAVDRAERQALHREFDRHGARHPQPDARSARRRRNHRRAEAVLRRATARSSCRRSTGRSCGSNGRARRDERGAMSRDNPRCDGSSLSY